MKSHRDLLGLKSSLKDWAVCVRCLPEGCRPHAARGRRVDAEGEEGFVRLTDWLTDWQKRRRYLEDILTLSSKGHPLFHTVSLLFLNLNVKHFPTILTEYPDMTLGERTPLNLFFRLWKQWPSHNFHLSCESTAEMGSAEARFSIPSHSRVQV